MLEIKGAKGVPLPAAGNADDFKNSFKDEDIVKRAVRIVVEQTPPALSSGSNQSGKPRLVHNAIQIPAGWNKTAEDVWKFEAPKEELLRSILFRTTRKDNLDGQAGRDRKARIVIELVCFVKGATKS